METKKINAAVVIILEFKIKAGFCEREDRVP